MSRSRPGLLLVVAALAVAWIVTVLTLRPDRPTDTAISPIAGLLQYLAAGVAAVVVGLRARSGPEGELLGAEFRFGDVTFGAPDDSGARSFWLGIGAAVVVMVANIAFLVVLDLVRQASGAPSGSDYLGWLSSGVVIGLLVGGFSAFVVLLLHRMGRSPRP